MGIPRLTQDVAPYAQTCILTRSQVDASIIKVAKLVIDGPSLVYHIYNALLRKRCNQDASSFRKSIAYSEINACLAQFLRDVSGCGVELHALIFDGALPISKRPTRLERLEKTRQNLDNYRKLQNYNGFLNQVGAAGRSVHQDLPSSELQAIIWDDSGVTSNKQSLLPPPPFMVASAIEYLRGSEWSDITCIVPGEADGYCATEAAASSSAILSNDSDLLLYDLGPTGVVMLLRTLEATIPALRDSLESLKGQCYRTFQLAKLLNVPSILEYGFHRSNDSSSTTSLIAQRARDTLLLKDNPDWTVFKREYEITDLQASSQSLKQQQVRILIQNLDPRLAETFVSLENSQSVHSYLPVVLEDPTRDSAWSYGLEIRQVAYSLLSRFNITNNINYRLDHLTEFARKGTRIADQHMKVLSQDTLLERIYQILDTYNYHFREEAQASTAAANHHTQSPRTRHNHSVTDPYTIMIFHLIAADTVITQRLRNSRFYMPELSNLFPHNNGMFPSSPRTTWDDIHFHASVQCMLYSLRMLKQVLSVVVQDSNLEPSPLKIVLQSAAARLVAMPSMSDLFIDAASLRDTVLKCSPKTVANGIGNLLQRVDPAYLKMLHGNDNKSTRRAESVLNANEQNESELQWTETTSKSRSKKRAKHSPTQTAVSRSGTLRLNPAGPKQTRLNAFALLQESGDGDD